ncbi:MAG: hypothetical protein QE487_06595 [Fluviicola sp.]|nr:hypothetical protein [Fluviicola sp.]
MSEFLITLKYRNETLFYFGLLCLFAALVFIILAWVNSNTVLGVKAWYKPFKFAFSIFLYSWTMGWFCSYLPNFSTSFFNWTVIVLLGFEIVYIALQASRGQLSHFNVSTPLYSAMYSMMAIAATIISLYTAYIAVLFFTSELPQLSTHYLWSIRLGLILFVIFSLEGFFMGSRMAHTVGAADGGGGIPILNWSMKYGDLRIAHFIGMHALQVLPILSYYVLKGTKLTIVLSIIYGLLAVFTLFQALQAKPIQKL